MSDAINGTAEDIFTTAKLGVVEGLDTAAIDCTNSSGLTALMLAADANNLLALQRLLKAGANPNSRKIHTGHVCACVRRDTSHVTALTIAINNHGMGCVKELIRAGCFFHCDRGLDALEMVERYGFLSAVAEGDKVMNNDLKHDWDQRGSAFYVAFKSGRFDLLKKLIDAGVSFNLKSLIGENVTTKENLIRLLPISAQNNPSGIVGNLETLLTHAVHGHDISIVRVLIEKYIDLDIVNFSKNKALQVACSGYGVELINALLVGAKMEAVSCSYIEVVKLLISSGADVNCVDEDGSTLLIKAVLSRQTEIVYFLLDNNVNIDQADDSQSTALHYACRRGNLDIVKLLVNAGAKVEVCNNENMTPFSEACKASNIERMKLLFNAGADINCVDTYHRTPLINSIRKENLDTTQFLCRDIRELNLATTQFLLEHGADISKVDIDGMTALMWAAKTYNKNIFDNLFDLGAEINCVDLKQMTALGHAVLSRRNVQMVAKLIQAGADVNIASNYQAECYKICKNTFLNKMQQTVEKCSSIKNTPLHLALSYGSCNNEIVNLLLKSGASVQAVDEHGRTPLHIAATLGNLEIAKSLCQWGANINAVDSYGNSPLFMSLLFENKELSTYLLECGVEVNVICESLCSPLFVAVLSNDTELVHLLIEHGAIFDKGKHSELMVALEHTSVEMLIALLEHGADANMRDTKKTPALTIAIKLAHHFNCYRFATPLGTRFDYNQMKVWRNEIKRVAESFLANGANVSATDDEGNTCLHVAAEFCSADVLELFVAHKVDVNVQNVKGETPLMMACRCGNVEAVRYLLTVGADVMVVDGIKNTALHHTTLKGNDSWGNREMLPEWLSCIVTLLIENNANIHARNEQGNTVLHLAVKFNRDRSVSALIKHGANVNDQNNEGNTPLFLINQSELIHYLIDARADINVRNNSGETALHLAFDNNVARALIEMGADMEIRTHEGRTALMCSTAAGKFLLAQWFVENGASVNAKDNEGRNALMLAIENNANKNIDYRRKNTDILKILLESGADVDASDVTGQTACMIAVKNDCADYFLEVLAKLVAYGADLNKQDNKKRSVLVHVLLNFETNKLNCISEILKLGADMAVDFEYQYLVKEMKKEIETHIEYGRTTNHWSQRMFQFGFVNGSILLQPFKLWGTDQTLKVPRFLACENLVFVKYLFAIGMIFKSDVQRLRKCEDNASAYASRSNVLTELQTAIQEPWPLVKLAFIEVSTLLGTGPTREEKLKQTKLPPRLQRTLMFREPISRLPIEDWSKIPLCFDPVQYETLPCPRPLLYYWPVGHKLVN